VIKGSQVAPSGKALKIKLFRSALYRMLKIINENSEIFQWNGFFNDRPLYTPSEDNSKDLIDSSSIPSPQNKINVSMESLIVLSRFFWAKILTKAFSFNLNCKSLCRMKVPEARIEQKTS
jgi:hypothetical protein